ncbi:MAG: spermidine synthase, partial [Acidimicrobiia bacterium]|nr:spermidine synthase [Acidimicrobiia bacterium]
MPDALTLDGVTTRPGTVRAVFVVAAFLGSALLFVIEPLVVRMLLPSLGGSPSVWNTAMTFFQASLLIGYALTHAVRLWLPPQVGPWTHIGILA